MIRTINIYNNGNVAIVIDYKCPKCGKKYWIFEGTDGSGVTMECLECGNLVEFKIQVINVSFQKDVKKMIGYFE